MRPIGSFDKDVREDCGDQFARRVLIEERNRVDGGESAGKFGPVVLVYEWTCGTFDPLYARIRVQRQDQDVAERSRAFKKPYVAGMENVVAAVCEDDRFPVTLPFC